MNRKFLLSGIFSFFFSFCFATNYYLSNAGNDDSSGTSPSEAWQTIDHLNTITLHPGDSILFESGGIFRGEIDLMTGGTADSVIYFGKYGEGDLPIISGAEKVSGWNLYSGNIYSADFSGEVTQLFADDELMTIGRYPNHGYLFQQGPTSDTSFIDSSLNENVNYWKGATVRMRINDQAWQSQVVDSFSSNVIYIEDPFSLPLTSGYGYYMSNLLTLIDTAGEWFDSTIVDKIFFYAPDGVDPSTLDVELSFFEFGINLMNGINFITIDSLRFEKQQTSGVLIGAVSHHIQILHCFLKDIGEVGLDIPFGGSQIHISDNFFSRCLSAGIRGSLVDSVTVLNNLFESIGLNQGYGSLLELNGIAIIFWNSTNVQVIQNLIDSTGSGGISIVAANSTFEKNLFNHNFLVTNSSGVITQRGTFNYDNSIRENFIFSPRGNTEATPGNQSFVHGILLNDSCDECRIFHNTITEASGNGIFLQGNSKNYTISGNLIYGCDESQIKFRDGEQMNSNTGNEIKQNVFYALNENQDVIKLESSASSFSPAYFDSNYYFNPYNYYILHFRLDTLNGELNFYFQLDEWRAETVNDENSNSSFVFWHRYFPIDTNGANLIENGSFTNNFDGWTNPHPENITMFLDNSTPLDGGCLKLIKQEGDFPDGSVFTDGAEEVDSGMYYLLSFSNYSIKNGNTRIYFSMLDSPFLSLGLNRFFPFTNERSDYWTIFQCAKNNDDGRFDVFINSKDSIAWVDGFSLLPVSVEYIEPKNKSRLFTNYSPLTVSFDLGDSIFYDLDQQQVDGQLTLGPYSSEVLLFDSSLISVNEPIVEKSLISMFPNPISPGSLVNVLLPESWNGNTRVSIFSGDNKMIAQFLLNHNQISRFKIPEDTPVGFYLISFESGNDLVIGRISVVR